MDNTQLGNFVAERIKAGLSQAEIKQQLLAVGWSEEEANAAYVGGLVGMGIPVPEKGRGRTGSKSSTVEIILNFFSFILLGTTATALGTLLFQIINKYFPDALSARFADYGSSSSIHYSIAALIVGFPIYYFSMKMWFNKFAAEPGKQESRLTKWLTYLVLLVTAVTIVGDLIAVIYRLLQGEITTRFFLKTLVILFIAGVIFGFYFLERRKVQYDMDVPQHIFRWIGWAVSAVIAIAIVLGFLAGGTPAAERQRSFDEQRAADLRDIASCVTSFAQDYTQLPASLNDLRKSPYSYCVGRLDPESSQPYEYIVTIPSQVNGSVKQAEFELCATFSLDSTANVGSVYVYNDKWSDHSAGRSCDKETVVLEDSRLNPTLPVPTRP
jgi:hypothetical protein